MASAVRRNGPYAPLGANYADDDAIATLDLGEDDRAELLYLRALAYCARDPRTEGYLSDIALRTGRVLRRQDGIDKAAERLVELHLWEREDKGYRITSWLKWNKSWAEISDFRKADTDRKKPASARPEPDPTPPANDSADPSCGVQTDSARTPDGVQDESSHHGTSNHVSTRHVTPPRTCAPHTVRTHTPRTPNTVQPGEFDEWWANTPRKANKARAKAAYTKARKTAEAQTLLDGIRTYRDDLSRDDAYTKHPATWLNGECWLDEGPVNPRSSQLALVRASTTEANLASTLGLSAQLRAAEQQQDRLRGGQQQELMPAAGDHR